MQEKVWNKKKNGMVVLVLSVLVYAVGIFMTVLGGIFTENGGSRAGIVLLAVGITILSVGWFPWLGLKVIKPQEALVLTLFGKYIGLLYIYCVTRHI